jgi:hypothetical protein
MVARCVPVSPHLWRSIGGVAVWACAARCSTTLRERLAVAPLAMRLICVFYAVVVWRSRRRDSDFAKRRSWIRLPRARVVSSR